MVQSISQGRQLGFNNDQCTDTKEKKSAFIRTAYFDGQYTNQYAQAKFTGHLIYRRFSVSGPNRPPRFKEGLMIPSGKEHDAIIHDNEVEPGCENIAELEDTSGGAVESSCVQPNNQRRCGTSERHQHDVEVVASCGHDSSSAWGQEVLGLLRSVGLVRSN